MQAVSKLHIWDAVGVCTFCGFVMCRDHSWIEPAEILKPTEPTTECATLKVCKYCQLGVVTKTEHCWNTEETCIHCGSGKILCEPCGCSDSGCCSNSEQHLLDTKSHAFKDGACTRCHMSCLHVFLIQPCVQDTEEPSRCGPVSVCKTCNMTIPHGTIPHQFFQLESCRLCGFKKADCVHKWSATYESKGYYWFVNPENSDTCMKKKQCIICQQIEYDKGTEGPHEFGAGNKCRVCTYQKPHEHDFSSIPQQSSVDRYPNLMYDDRHCVTKVPKTPKLTQSFRPSVLHVMHHKIYRHILQDADFVTTVVLTSVKNNIL